MSRECVAVAGEGILQHRDRAERTAEFTSRADGAVPAVLRIMVGPVTWQICDATAYASMHRAWRQAARLLGDNPTDDQ